MGEEGIREAYRTGKGRIYIRSKTEIEECAAANSKSSSRKFRIKSIKSRLVTAMENIRLEKKVEGIAEVRDESGRDGLRIVIELRKDADAEGILTYLVEENRSASHL